MPAFVNGGGGRGARRELLEERDRLRSVLAGCVERIRMAGLSEGERAARFRELAPGLEGLAQSIDEITDLLARAA